MAQCRACVEAYNPVYPFREQHWDHLGVENTLFELQPAVLSWKCLAQPHHCSKTIREHRIQNCLQWQKWFCLSQGILSVCQLIPPMLQEEAGYACASVACFFFPELGASQEEKGRNSAGLVKVAACVWKTWEKSEKKSQESINRLTVLPASPRYSSRLF